MMLILLAACRPTISARDVTVEVSEDISTVVTVSWSAEPGSTGWVEYGPTEDYGWQTPTATAAGDSEASAQLLGLRADTTYHLRVVADDGGASDDLTVTTGALPTALPALIQDGDPGAWDGFTPTPLIGITNAAVIVDSAGEVVWYWIFPEDGNFDSKGGRRVALARDGSGVYINQIGAAGLARIHKVSWDGSKVHTIEALDHNHDFVSLPDGSLVGLFYDDLVQDDGSRLTADKVARVEEDGTITDLWSAHDDLSPKAEPPLSDSWTHANALDAEDDGDVLYVGMRNLSSIIRLDEGGTRLDWILGDPRYGFSDFDFIDGAVPFDRQHQFEFLGGDRLLVFDNNSTGGDEDSRAVEYQLDLDAQTVSPLWSHDLGVGVYALGEAARLADESTFLNLSVNGTLELVDAEGETAWTLSTALGYAFGYGVPVPTLYSE